MDPVQGKRLVIFGCGYVGSEVARQAVARDVRVTALTRNPETAVALRVEGVDVVVADLATDDWHREISGGADYVLNAVSSGARGVEGYRHSYVAGMQSVLRWASANAPMGTLVYTSSTSVYPQDNGVHVDEFASTEGVGELPRVLLAAERLLSEASHKAVRDATRSSAVPVRPFNRYFIFRLAGIYGPGRHHLVDQVRSGAVSGRGDHHLNLVHRDDIVSAIWSAFEAPQSVRSGIFNVADDGAASKNEIVTWLARQLGLPPPAFSGVPVAARRTITPDRIIDNAKLKTVLGWRLRYPTFRDGYKNMLAPHAE
jgi:nucleoside-diphosphate-sugar epimerase